MARQEPSCPTCDADIPLSGDEAPGDEIFCPYCRAPLTLSGKGDEIELEEDY